MHTMILVLINLTVSFLRLDHEFIVPKSSIYKSIDKCPARFPLAESTFTVIPAPNNFNAKSRFSKHLLTRVLQVALIHILQTLHISHTHLLPKLLGIHAQLAVAQALQQVLWQLVLEVNICISIGIL